MILSDRTLSILKNFATINPSIVIPEGNTLAVVTVGNHIYGRAVVDDYFPTELAIYDLNKFLGAVSLLKQPAFDFDTPGVIKMSNGPTTIRYACADPSLIHKAPAKAPALPDPIFVSNELSSHVLNQVIKAASVMRLNDISLKTEDGKMLIVAHEADNPSADQYRIELDEALDIDCNIHINIDNMKMHAGADYTLYVYQLKSGAVIIGAQAREEGELMYLISSEADSQIN